MLKKYNNDNPQNKEFDKPNESLLKRFKAVMPFGSKTNDDTFNELLSGEDSFATISQNFDQWSIYFLAHKVSVFVQIVFYFVFKDDGDRKLEYC